MSGSYYPLPLKKVDLSGTIVNSVCSYEMEQHYINIENIAVETEFLFPILDNTFISKIKCQFKLKDGTTETIETQIVEKPLEKENNQVQEEQEKVYKERGHNPVD